MSFDPVPWFVENGRHSSNVARNIAYAAFGGREGIVRSTDLEVRALATPGAGVQVYPGSCSVLNRSVAGEMYAGRGETSSTVDIAATGSVGRSDMVIARVVNDYYEGGFPASGWPPLNSDPQLGPFFAPYVLSNVPASARTVADVDPSISGIALARIDMPANTSAITQAMITDLRQMSGVRTQRDFNVLAPTARQDLTSSTYVNFPKDAKIHLPVPEWATHAKIRGIFSGIGFGGDGSGPTGNGWNVFGDMRFQFGLEADNAVFSQPTMFNLSNDGGHDRTTIMVGAPGLFVPARFRGDPDLAVIVEARKEGGTSGVEMWTDESSMLSMEVEFAEEPESNV